MARPANPFGENYRIEFKAQQAWGVPHALEFFLLGVGSGLYLFSTWLNPFTPAQLVSVVLVVAGGLSLMTDLGRPGRLWRAMSNLRASWISRGAFAVFLFLVGAIGGLAVRGMDLFPSLPEFSSVCEGVASLFALVVMLYPGLVLSSFASIPSWNSPMVPLLFFVYSWTTGLAAQWSIYLFSGPTDKLAFFLGIGFFLLAFTLICLLIHVGVMARGSVAVREGFRRLTRGALSPWFIGAVVGAGLLLPLLLIGSALGTGKGVELSAFISSILVLGGGFFFRYCILKAGVYPPLF
jgi:formate-dependent nitrite reductase membrane component NrfD